MGCARGFVLFGTLNSPLVISNDSCEYTDKIDVYSFGIVMWEMITAQLPFEDQEIEAKLKQLILGGGRPPIPPSCPKFFAKLIQKCWDHNPDKRPSFQQLLHALENYKEKQNSESLSQNLAEQSLLAPPTPETGRMKSF